MKKTLGEFLHELIKKTGADADREEFKNFLLNGELVKIEIPEAVSQVIDSGLISLRDAKNNHPEIKPHYVSQALNPIDQSQDEWFEEFGIPEEERQEILKERSTYKRVPLLMKKIKEIEGKKAASTDKGEIATFKKQIDDLHAAIRSEKEEKKNLEKKFQEDMAAFKVDMHQESIFGNYKTTLDDLPAGVKKITIKNLIQEALRDKSAKLAFDENGKFILLGKDGMNFYGDNNQQVEPTQFIESVLSANKILVTTPANQSQGQGAAQQQQQRSQQSQQQQSSNPTGGQGGANVNPTLKNLIDQSAKAFEQGAK